MNPNRHRTTFAEDDYIEWAGCPASERVPGKLSGAPAVVGARSLADIIAQCHDLDSLDEEIQENFFSLSLERSGSNRLANKRHPSVGEPFRAATATVGIAHWPDS